MSLSLDALLDTYRASAATEREKGTYYERLCASFLQHDPVQAKQYEQVLTWSEWAARNGIIGKDVGIDLVVKHRGHDGYAGLEDDGARHGPDDTARERHSLRNLSSGCDCRTPKCRSASPVWP